MRSWFKRFLKSDGKKREEQRSFLENGSKLLEELVALCDGRSNPIRYFSASQLQKAIQDFRDPLGVMIDLEWCKGVLDTRLVLIRKCRGRREEVCRDIAITSQMSSHRNVLKLVGCCLQLPVPAMVYEYPVNRSLDTLVYDQKLTWETRLTIAREIAYAISYLHSRFSRPIIHRDIQPGNIFLDQHFVAKLADFSSSITIPAGELCVEPEDSMVGTFGYLDPDSIQKNAVTEKTDVYSFGSLLLVLITGWPIVSCNSSLVTYVKGLVEKGQLSKAVDPSILENGERLEQARLQALLELGLRCTSLPAEERPTMIQVTKKLREIEVAKPSLIGHIPI